MSFFFFFCAKSANRIKFLVYTSIMYYKLTGMLGYGMAKAAVHQLVKGLADEKGGLPSNASVLAILP